MTESNGTHPSSEVLLDIDRTQRTGLAEAIFCEGKSPSQLLTICEQVQADGLSMLFTRLSESQFLSVSEQFTDFMDYDPVSRTGLVKPRAVWSRQQVAIVTGGSSDVPVAREAARTLAFYGVAANEIDDVGVAGLWRITARLPDIRPMSVVICIAGMDAALPTVLGGLIPASLIAVPTSVGYGMVKEGETALRSLLVSCAPGLTVVNIDNGYGAACAAMRILNQIHRKV